MHTAVAHATRRLRRLSTAAAVAVAVAVPAVLPAQAFPTETFSNVPIDSKRVLLRAGNIAGTGLRVTDGQVQILDDPSQTNGQGSYMWMMLGIYAQTWNPTTAVGTAALEAVNRFDLFAGVTYTLRFDWTRQGFSAGNGPFPFSLQAMLGTQSLTVSDVAGFYSSLNWQTAVLSFTPATTQLGAALTFAGTGAGYTGLYLDNISMVGVAGPGNPPVTGVVPEPSTWALLLTGMASLGMVSRRRRINSMS